MPGLGCSQAPALLLECIPALPCAAPAQLGRGSASPEPSVEQIPGPRDVHACVCVRV